jgi:outer membrane immunogenic protein
MRISKYLLSSAFAAIAATAAFGAHAQTAPTFNWTGPYVGINAGDDFDGATRFDRATGAGTNNVASLAAGIRPTGQAVHGSGFTGGAQIGYNYQLGAGSRYGLGLLGLGGAGVVGGLEADAQYTDIHRNDTLSNTTNLGPLVTPSTTAFTRVNQYDGDLDFLGTVRGRLGLAFDRMLIYGTGGFAYGDVQRQAVFYGPNTPTTPFFTGESNGMRTGFTYGGGVEYAVTANSFLDRFNVFHASGMTIKAEYLHYDLGADTVTLAGVNGGAGIGSYTYRVRTDGDLVRAGINYKF